MVALAASLIVLAACGGSSKKAAPPTTAPASTTTTAAASQAATWTTYGGSNTRAAAADADADLGRPAEQWRSPPLSGLVYAQPLLAGDRAIVATEANVVYSIDRSNGQIQWQAPLGPPVNGQTLPCGNIDPSGITGTPAVDTSAGVIYVVAFLADGPHHELFALDLGSGAVKWHRLIDPPGLSAKVEQERGALAVANGRVYVPFGGLFGDCGQYKGAVVSSDPSGTGPLQTFVVPTNREGGIWAPPGVTVGADGSLFVATGNTDGRTNFDDGNAVVRLTPDLKQGDVFAPADWAKLNSGDTDLGTQSPVLLSPSRVFVAGKSGIAYILDAQHLGGVGHPMFSDHICGAAFGGSAVSGDHIVVACSQEMVGLTVTGDRFSVAWRKPFNTPGPPVISHKSVWFGDQGGTLHAVSLSDGADGYSATAGKLSRFASVAVSGDQLVLGAGGVLISYKLGAAGG